MRGYENKMLNEKYFSFYKLEYETSSCRWKSRLLPNDNLKKNVPIFVVLNTIFYSDFCFIMLIIFIFFMMSLL